MTLTPVRAAAGTGRWEANARVAVWSELLPPPLSFSVNLIKTMNGGTLAAGAEIVHRGRTTMVVDVRGCDSFGGRAGR
jgi:acyl-coenzyme A thioesterase PaaI-like protein